MSRDLLHREILLHSLTSACIRPDLRYHQKNLALPVAKRIQPTSIFVQQLLRSMLSFSITPIQKTHSFVTLLLKLPFKARKKRHKKPFFFRLCTFSIFFSVVDWRKKEKVLKGHFKNISKRNIKETTAFKRDPSCQTKSKVALHNDYLIAQD